MKILHIVPHCGGGVGSVLMGWMDRVIAANDHGHRIVCLDYANDKAKAWADKAGFYMTDKMEPYPRLFEHEIADADIVLVHYWDHPMLADLFSKPLPKCRLIFWVHKHYPIPENEVQYPDRCIGTSRIQHLPDWIWSTGGVDRFLKIQPDAHEGFNIGYVGTVDYKKIHPNFIKMCSVIIGEIPDVYFTFIGDTNKDILRSLFQPLPPSIYPLRSHRFHFTGKVEDVAPYLAEMDVLGYPLRPDHYGTSEQVLGEAMSVGVVPVVMDNPCERTIINHRKDGLIATAEDKYVSFIKYLHDYPDSRAIMSENCRIRAKELYSLDTMISKWNDVFDELMTQPKRERRPL